MKTKLVMITGYKTGEEWYATKVGCVYLVNAAADAQCTFGVSFDVVDEDGNPTINVIRVNDCRPLTERETLEFELKKKQAKLSTIKQSEQSLSYEIEDIQRQIADMDKIYPEEIVPGLRLIDANNARVVVVRDEGTFRPTFWRIAGFQNNEFWLWANVFKTQKEAADYFNENDFKREVTK